MSKNDTSDETSSRAKSGTSREDRLAEALRKNLRRRKAAAKAARTP